MPFPNEHAARQRAPSGFVRYRRQNNKGGSGVHFIFGVTRDGTAVLQSIRFSASAFTPEEARAWLRRHKYKTGLEAASKPASEALVVEASFVVEGGRIKAVLIREGVSKNRNKWTRDVLRRMVAVVENAPVHLYDFSRDGSRGVLHHWEVLRQRLQRMVPPAIARLLPERFGNAEVGRVRNAALAEGADGRAEIRADIEPHAERGGLLRAVIEELRRVGRELGLSVHVPEDGLESRSLPGRVREILNVTRVVGFDAVSFPSAGGRVLPVLEALAGRSGMKNWLKRLLRLVPEDRRAVLEGVEIPDELESPAELLKDDRKELLEAIVEALDLAEVDAESIPAVIEGMVRATPEEEPKPRKRKKASKKKTTRRKAKPVVEEDEDDEGDEDDEPAARDPRVDQILLENGQDVIDGALESARLPEGLTKFARTHLEAKLEADGQITRKTVKDFIAGLKAGLGATSSNSVVEGARPRISHGPWTSGERMQAALGAMIAGEAFAILEGEDGKKEKVPAFRSLRESWGQITGDVYCQGRDYFFQPGVRRSDALESIDWEENPYWLEYMAKVGGGLTEAAKVSADYALLLSREMHKRLLKEYATLAHLWRRVCKPTPVSDFKQRNIIQFGEFGQLALVNEASNPTGYAELTYPSEDDITATIAKYGGLALFSWESIVNDDLRKLQRIAPMMARAAERTLNTLIWGKILNNSNIYDGTALFTSGHGNLVSLAYSADNLKTMRKQMTRQKDLDDEEAGRIKPSLVSVGPELIDQVAEDIGSSGKAQLKETGEIGTAASGDRDLEHDHPGKPNVLRTRYGLGLQEVHEFDEVSGADDNYYMTADPDVVDWFEVGFLNGNQDPALFVQDMERVGSMFDDDVITWKVRHVHDGGVITDFRGAQGGIAP